MDIKAFNLFVRAHAKSDGVFDRHEDDGHCDGGEGNDRCDSKKLRKELVGAASEEQSLLPVVGLFSSEEAHSDNTPDSTDSVN